MRGPEQGAGSTVFSSSTGGEKVEKKGQSAQSLQTIREAEGETEGRTEFVPWTAGRDRKHSEGWTESNFTSKPIIF